MACGCGKQTVPQKAAALQTATRPPGAPVPRGGYKQWNGPQPKGA